MRDSRSAGARSVPPEAAQVRAPARESGPQRSRRPRLQTTSLPTEFLLEEGPHVARSSSSVPAVSAASSRTRRRWRSRCSPTCMLASRTHRKLRQDRRARSSRCTAARSAPRRSTPTTSPQLDARCSKDYKPDVVINVALPYQDLHIMDACLEAGVDYLDTANYEPLDVAKFEYKWQWAYQERFAEGRPDGAARLGLRSGRDERVLRVRPEAPARRDPLRRHRRLQRRHRTARRSRPTSIPRSTSARSRRAAATGRTASGRRPIRSACRGSSTTRASARRRASCSITRSSSRSRRTSRASSGSGSG